jgi:argininosuccinate lyase
MKLWQKEHTHTTEKIELFTVGRDKEFDLLLAKYDVQGSLAHTQMLHTALACSHKIELTQIHEVLNRILADIDNGIFTLDDAVEDIHSQIELMLTKEIGETGKKNSQRPFAQ